MHVCNGIWRFKEHKNIHLVLSRDFRTISYISDNIPNAMDSDKQTNVFPLSSNPVSRDVKAQDIPNTALITNP